MGFTPPRRVYRLIFEDDQYSGLEVSARSASVAAYQDIAELSTIDVHNISAADRQRIDQLFELFGEHLVDWNVEDEQGQPVPPTATGLRMQELPFAYDIIRAWMQAVAGVAPDLSRAPAEPEDPGVDLASLPMEVLAAL